MSLTHAVMLAAVLAGCGRIGFEASGPRDGAAVDADESGLVRYPMDEPTFPGVLKASIAGYDGSCMVCPTAAPGVFGGAAQFAQSALVSIPTSLIGLSPYSVAIWANVQNPIDRSSIVTKAVSLTGDTNTFSLWVDAVSGHPFYETSDGTSIDALEGPDDVRGAWHHFAMTWDGSEKRFYVDGMVKATALATISDSTVPVTIGADVDAGMPGVKLMGSLDELRFYPRALADSELALLAVP